MDCQETLDRYLAVKQAQCRPTTLQRYRADVGAFIEFLASRYPEINSFAKLKREPHIERWLKLLASAQPPYTDGCRGAIIGSVRRFLRDLQKLGWPESPPPAPPRLFMRLDLPPGYARKYADGTKVPSRRPERLEVALLSPAIGGAYKRYLDVRSATLRPGTLRCYKQDILHLLEFLQNAFPQLDSFSKLERHPHIEGWLSELANRHPRLKNGTRREYIRNVARFLEDMYEWNWPECPSSGLIRREDLPPCEHRLPKPLPPDVDAVLLGALKREGDHRSLGLIVARRAGLRVGELCRLERDCLLERPGDRYALRIPLGKLRSERVVPLDSETAQLVKQIRDTSEAQPNGVVDPETGKVLHLLFSTKKNVIPYPGAFAWKLKAVAKSSGIVINVHPHRLRHTYATELLRAGVSLLAVMKLLGHRTPLMTLCYLEVTNEDIERDYIKALEKTQVRYSELQIMNRVAVDDAGEPGRGLGSDFEQLIARVQAARLDHSDPGRRKSLQRLVERLRRAQSELPDLLK